MQYTVFAVHGVDTSSCHGEIMTDDYTSWSYMMVELRTRKRGMRGDGTNLGEKVNVQSNLYASQFTIPDMAGTNPAPACIHINLRSSHINQASDTPDFSYLLASSTFFLTSSSITLCLVYNSTIIAEHKVMPSSLSLHMLMLS
jgi:hypothetical protein